MSDNLNFSRDYRNEVIRLIRDLTTVHYYSNSDGRTLSVLNALTQRDLSYYLGVTYVTVSRAASGVTSLSGEAFYLLVSLHTHRLSNTIGYSSLKLALV